MMGRNDHGPEKNFNVIETGTVVVVVQDRQRATHFLREKTTVRLTFSLTGFGFNRFVM